MPEQVAAQLHRPDHHGARHLGHVHDRAPVILPPDMFADWLDPGTTDKADVQQLLDAIPEPVLTPRIVSSRINSGRNDGPELLEPVPPDCPWQRGNSCSSDSYSILGNVLDTMRSLAMVGHDESTIGIQELKKVRGNPTANILIVVSAADKLTMKDGSEHPAGYWAMELVVAHRTLLEAGHHRGFRHSRRGETDCGQDQPADRGGRQRGTGGRLRRVSGHDRRRPVRAAGAGRGGSSAYDAVVLPGGHGPMADLYKDKDLGRILVEMNGAGKIIAPFCHGPAGN